MYTRFIQGLKIFMLITLGSFITGVSISIFMVPYKIAPGGVSGLATVIFYLSGGRFPVGITMLALNIPLFVMGAKFIGRKFVFRSLYGAISLSLIIDAIEPLAGMLIKNYLNTTQTGNGSNLPDLLLYALFGGVIMGVGLGIVFRAGATTGGTDLAARIVNHSFPKLTMGQALLIIDTSVIIVATVFFNSFQLGLYAIVTLYVSSKIIDAMLEGVSFARAVFIISDHSDNIAASIMAGLDRGVTALKGTGMYTGNDKQVLLCVLHRGQIPQLKKIVNDVDDKAFIILADIREVLGEGFKTY